MGCLGLGYYRDDDEAADELEAVEAAALLRRASSLKALAARAGSPPRAGPLLRTGSLPRASSLPRARATSLAADGSTLELLSPVRARLARKEHWRVCPSCARVVETRRCDI